MRGFVMLVKIVAHPPMVMLVKIAIITIVAHPTALAFILKIIFYLVMIVDPNIVTIFHRVLRQVQTQDQVQIHQVQSHQVLAQDLRNIVVSHDQY